MREVESCFQRLEQRYALFTSGPARADRFLETVSPAPADVVRTTLFSVDSKAKNRPAHRKADTTGKTTVLRCFFPYRCTTTFSFSRRPDSHLLVSYTHHRPGRLA